MSDTLTRITLPGSPGNCGFMDWGRKTVDEMIATIRRNAERDKKEAEAVLAAPDDAFQVDVVRGSIVQHHVKELQHSSRKDMWDEDAWPPRKVKVVIEEV